jgi:hypothetical protein
MAQQDISTMEGCFDQPLQFLGWKLANRQGAKV